VIYISKYFDLNQKQKEHFEALISLYLDWNEKINLISRKDIENLELHHLVHSMAISKYIDFKPGSEIIDLGCGGGFPGIMLAILFPQSYFLLIDSKNKKITVVNEIIQSLGLKNAIGIHGRAEELKNKKFDFVVSRAVAKIDQLKLWSHKLIKSNSVHSIPNGLITLKGDIELEKSLLTKSDYYESVALNTYFEEEYFNEKYLLYVQY